MKMNVAVIGCGYWGKNLVRNFYELGVLKSICDASTQTLSVLAVQHEGIETTTSLDDVLEDGSIGAIAIAAPAAMHYEFTKRCLIAGKDVFVEKPLALRVSEGEELVRLAREYDRVLMVGHILHYHPAVRSLKNIVSKGTLGRIQYIYSNRLSFGKIRREENILWSFAPHDISMILDLIGEEPDEVSARGSNYLHPEISDVTVSQMRFPNGVNAHIFVSWLHPFKEQKLVVVGEKQMAVFDDTLPWESKLTLYPHEVIWSNGLPQAKKAEGVHIRLEEAEPLKEECRHYIECVTNRTRPITDCAEGLRGLKVLNALQESLDNNGVSIATEHSPFTNHQSPDVFVHETAVVESGAIIGKGTKVWHFAHVMPGAEIGENCSLGQNVVVMPGSRLGNNVKVQNNVSVYEKVICEDDVFLGPSMVFTNVMNPRSHISRKNEYKNTVVRKGATIGANATIVCGNEIGEYAFIGSGSVVTKDIQPYALVYGNPARQAGWMCQCGVKLKMGINDNDKDERTTCSACGISYVRKRFLVSSEW